MRSRSPRSSTRSTPTPQANRPTSSIRTCLGARENSTRQRHLHPHHAAGALERAHAAAVHAPVLRRPRTQGRAQAGRPVRLHASGRAARAPRRGCGRRGDRGDTAKETGAQFRAEVHRRQALARDLRNRAHAISVQAHRHPRRVSQGGPYPRDRTGRLARDPLQPQVAPRDRRSPRHSAGSVAGSRFPSPPRRYTGAPGPDIGGPIMDTIDRSLSEEQRLMRESCRAFVNDFVTPYIRQNWQREWLMDPDARLPRPILEQADRIGIRTLGVPEEFGGVPLDPAHEVQTFALISAEIARGDSGLSAKLVQIWKVSVLLRNVAPRHLQERWFPRLVKDPAFLLAHCLTEPRGASDRWLPYNAPEAAMQTRAVLKGDEWVINGRKQSITNGYDASLYVVYANTRPGAGMLQGTSSFLVPP